MSVEQASTYLTWTPPGESLVIRLDHRVIERLSIDVMKGFGVTRRRGTETGGLLIGKIDRRTEPVIHIQDYEVVPCEYALGPSYILSFNDKEKFKNAVARWQPSLERELYAVGYFRSHTRDGFSFDDKDAALFREYFQDPLDIALLIKPFATRSASAGFFLQENGSLATESSTAEFTFSPPGKRAPELVEAVTPTAEAVPNPSSPAPRPAQPKEMERQGRSAVYERPMFTQPQGDSPVWRRMSQMAFGAALLAFGGVCGYEYAGVQALRPGSADAVKAASDLFSVRLRAARADDSLVIKWDRDAGPIQAALHGLLIVTEGANSKEVKLGFAELRNGTALYPHVGPAVTFRLELYFKDNRSFSESTDFKQTP